MSTESAYVVNAKTALGTIVTVRGDTAAQLAANINEFEQQGLAVAVAAFESLVTGKPAAPTAQAAAAAFGGTIVEEAPAFAPVPPPAAAPAAPLAGERTCKHGVMTYRTGNGAKGPWRGFFCPTPKGTPDQCSPQFVR